MTQPLWQLLMRAKNDQPGQDMTCEECFSILDFYAEELATGVDLKILQPSIARHLSRCPHCRSKFIEWVDRLDRSSS